LTSSDDSDCCPEAVRLLLHQRVTDFEELEILLLLLRQPEGRYTVRATADQLRIPAELVAQSMDALCAHGLLVRFDDGPSYQFRPASAELTDDCEALRGLYDKDRFAIVRLMGHLAIERVRKSTPIAFANAFRFRKPPSGGGSGA
jgi:hypothetical protein